MTLDKNKSYRFRGDSERWEHVTGTGWFPSGDRSHSVVRSETFEHLHERGILLEYPELPGDDWEFCERVDAECGWSDDYEHWANLPSVDDISIYCRKKKPVITEVEGEVMLYGSSSCTHIACPIRDWLKPGDRVKVTKL